MALPQEASDHILSPGCSRDQGGYCKFEFPWLSELTYCWFWVIPARGEVWSVLWLHSPLCVGKDWLWVEGGRTGSLSRPRGAACSSPGYAIRTWTKSFQSSCTFTSTLRRVWNIRQSARRACVAPSPGGLQDVAGGELGEGILGLKCQERKDKKSVQSQITPPSNAAGGNAQSDSCFSFLSLMSQQCSALPLCSSCCKLCFLWGRSARECCLCNFVRPGQGFRRFRAAHKRYPLLVHFLSPSANQHFCPFSRSYELHTLMA